MHLANPATAAFHQEMVIELKQRFLPMLPGWMIAPLELRDATLASRITADRGPHVAAAAYDLFVQMGRSATVLMRVGDLQAGRFWEDVPSCIALDLRDPACFVQGALRAIKQIMASEGMVFDRRCAMAAIDASSPAVEPKLQANLVALKAVLLANELRIGNERAGAALLRTCQMLAVERANSRHEPAAHAKQQGKGVRSQEPGKEGASSREGASGKEKGKTTNARHRGIRE